MAVITDLLKKYAINILLYPSAILGSLALTLGVFLWFSQAKIERLQTELIEIKAKSDRLIKDHEIKVKEQERNHETAKADIDARYADIIKRLQQQANNRGIPATSGNCESEQRADADRMCAELFGRYASVARYADELKLNGMNCENLRN